MSIQSIVHDKWRLNIGVSSEAISGRGRTAAWRANSEAVPIHGEDMDLIERDPVLHSIAEQAEAQCGELSKRRRCVRVAPSPSLF